jgi:CheY-like chemotaxis protein
MRMAGRPTAAAARCPPGCRYEVARHLRQDYPHLMLPIIMVSANKLEEHVVEGLQVGGTGFWWGGVGLAPGQVRVRRWGSWPRMRAVEGLQAGAEISSRRVGVQVGW